MKLIVPKDDKQNFIIADWTARNLGVEFYPPYYAVGIARHEHGPMLGAFVFNDFNRHQIELTMYGERCLTPSIVRQVAHYVFVQLGCSRVTVRTKQSNTKVRRLIAKHFEFECVSKRYYGNENAIVHYMLAEKCPWLEKVNENIIAA